MRKFFITILLLYVVQLAFAGPTDYVWTSQSRNSSESMPLGGGSVGLNVWVENGELLFYIQRSGSFDANNTLLKAGRVRISMDPMLDTTSIRQTLRLSNGSMIVSDGHRELLLWVDTEKPVVHVRLDASDKTKLTIGYETWRYKDRPIANGESFQCSYKFGVPAGCMTRRDSVLAGKNGITFYHVNEDSTVFDATVAQQHLQAYKKDMYDPLRRLISGGRMSLPGMSFAGTYDGVYMDTDYRGWRYVSNKAMKHQHITITLANRQGTEEEWMQTLLATKMSVDYQKDFRTTRQWWHQWWKRSYILATEGKAGEMARNYTLFRYMMGCNAKSEWPTRFNGGLFTFDPSSVESDYTWTPDYRRWGGGTFTAQNQRLLYWPMLKSGDYDAMYGQLQFYKRILKNAEIRSKAYWNHGGAAFTEQLENFGLPEYDEYGKTRPEGFDDGLQYNAWLEYTWDTVLEFCQMALEAHRYSGMDIEEYVPLIMSSLDFFDEHYRMLARKRGRDELDDKGHVVIYPGSGAETFKMAYNPTSTCVALRTVTQSLLDYLTEEETREQQSDASSVAADSSSAATDSVIIKKYERMLSQWPDIALRQVDGHTVIAPAVVWGRVNNTEPTMLYPVYPWRQMGVGRDNYQLALDTWTYDPYVKQFEGISSWEQTGIFAACLGLTDDAAKWNWLKMKNGKHRFPAFYGPGHDWTPDHNWGGSGMIGMQEMLMQETDDAIYLFPAWPKEWDVKFRLHGEKGNIIEGELKNGKVVQATQTRSDKRLVTGE